jgi:hypothetical protein
MAARLAPSSALVRLHAPQHLAGDTHVEFVLRGRLSLGIILAHGGTFHLLKIEMKQV